MPKKSPSSKSKGYSPKKSKSKKKTAVSRAVSKGVSRRAKKTAAPTYTVVCAVCGSTNTTKVNMIDTCVDCSSTQILTVPINELQATQNRILENKVEERFHSYLEEKHTRLSRQRLKRIVSAIIVLIVLVMVLLLSSGM